jgi:hypothetical protein
MDHLMMSMAGAMGLRVIPEMPETSYALGDAKMLAGIAILMAQESVRAADTLVRENQAMRQVFALAAEAGVSGLDTDPAMLAQSEDADLTLTTLEANNARLKTTLITLHAMAEETDAPWGRKIDAAIWALLARGAGDRMFVLPSL